MQAMEKTYCSVVRDGDEQLVIVPENKTVEFYKYLRGYGFSLLASGMNTSSPRLGSVRE